MMDNPQFNKSAHRYCLLGAVAGDIIGSRFEYCAHKSTEFELFTHSNKFTDDTVLTLAVADSILRQRDYGEIILEYGRRFPHADYGGSFRQWLASSNPRPYGSFGNGSAMRVSPIAWAFNTIEDVLKQAELSALPTHNHPEGVKGAQAVALAIYLARNGRSKKDIQDEISERFAYSLENKYEQIQPGYKFDETCQATVPAALIAFFDSHNFLDAIRKAVALGGDADTLAAITGSIAEAYYGGAPEDIIVEVHKVLPQGLWQVISRFSVSFPNS
jgi:ADP-ribosylglycohydrolase